MVSFVNIYLNTLLNLSTGGGQTCGRVIDDAHQGRIRLPGPLLPAHPSRCGHQPQGRSSSGQVLPAQEADPRVEGTHQGHLLHQVVPEVGPSHPVWRYG